MFNEDDDSEVKNVNKSAPKKQRKHMKPKTMVKILIWSGVIGIITGVVIMFFVLGYSKVDQQKKQEAESSQNAKMSSRSRSILETTSDGASYVYDASGKVKKTDVVDREDILIQPSDVSKINNEMSQIWYKRNYSNVYLTTGNLSYYLKKSNSLKNFKFSRIDINGKDGYATVTVFKVNKAGSAKELEDFYNKELSKGLASSTVSNYPWYQGRKSVHFKVINALNKN